MALVDLGLPPTPHRPDEGFALVTELLALAPSMPIVVLSGQNDEANARHARALGAADFVAKPADPETLRETLHRLLRYGERKPATAIELIGQSLPMDKLRAQLRQYANSPFPVLIEGESGSGKELAADALHRLSERAAQPYLALNCAAISPNLVEPTLFGHAKGAFTGAAGAPRRLFRGSRQTARCSSTKSASCRSNCSRSCLRVLENGQYQRVGETQQRVSRARVIAATNRDLKKEVREGRFRADLYHRLSVFTDQRAATARHGQRPLPAARPLPPRLCTTGRRQPSSLCRRGGSTLGGATAFPGNVRELRNIVIRLIAQARRPNRSRRRPRSRTRSRHRRRRARRRIAARRRAIADAGTATPARIRPTSTSTRPCGAGRPPTSPPPSN